MYKCSVVIRGAVLTWIGSHTSVSLPQGSCGYVCSLRLSEWQCESEWTISDAKDSKPCPLQTFELICLISYYENTFFVTLDLQSPKCNGVYFWPPWTFQKKIMDISLVVFVRKALWLPWKPLQKSNTLLLLIIILIIIITGSYHECREWRALLKYNFNPILTPNPLHESKNI